MLRLLANVTFQETVQNVKAPDSGALLVSVSGAGSDGANT